MARDEARDDSDVDLLVTLAPGISGLALGGLLLDAQDKQAYLLLDADPSTVRPGARIEVVGQRVDQIVSICSQGVPRPGSTNCGRKARKKRAVFGLKVLTTIPWR